MGSDGGNMRLLNYVYEASERREVCRDFDEAPHVPGAGAPRVFTFYGKLHVGHMFLGDIFALCAADA